MNISEELSSLDISFSQQKYFSPSTPSDTSSSKHTPHTSSTVVKTPKELFALEN